MVRNINILLFFLLASVPFGVQGQDRELDHGLKLIASLSAEQVMLRWAPTSLYSWERCNESGYVVVRHHLKQDGSLLPLEVRSQPVILTPEPIKPWQDQEQWKALIEKNEVAAVGAQAIFGGSFEVTGENSTQVSLINQLKESKNRYSFGLFAADQSFEVAEAMGLALVDRTIDSGATYLYRIYPAASTSSKIDTGFTSVDQENQFLLPKIIDFDVAFGNKISTISWNKEIFKNHYSTYVLEKSSNGIDYQALKDLPFISPTKSSGFSELGIMVDSLAFNDRPYFYRIRGKTIFDELGPPSEPIQGMGIDPLPYYYPNIETILPADEKFDIRWSFNQSDEDKILALNYFVL